jgi:hypothetical protein
MIKQMSRISRIDLTITGINQHPFGRRFHQEDISAEAERCMKSTKRGEHPLGILRKHAGNIIFR